MELAKEKKLYLLTATPINNSLGDISNLINYFGQPSNHFARIGVHDFRKHFRDIEKRFEDEHAEIAEKADDEDLLRQDPVLKQVLIQRSREYIKHAERNLGLISSFLSALSSLRYNTRSAKSIRRSIVNFKVLLTGKIRFSIWQSTTLPSITKIRRDGYNSAKHS